MTSNPAPAVPWLALVRGETSGSRCSQGHGCMAGMWLLLRPAVGGNRAGEARPRLAWDWQPFLCQCQLLGVGVALKEVKAAMP